MQKAYSYVVLLALRLMRLHCLHYESSGHSMVIYRLISECIQTKKINQKKKKRTFVIKSNEKLHRVVL